MVADATDESGPLGRLGQAPNLVDPTEQDELRRNYPAWQEMGEYRLVQRTFYDAFALRSKLVQTGRIGGKQDRNQHRIDRQWVSSKATRPYSFIWCCEILNFDPTYARRAYWRGRIVIPVNHSAIYAEKWS